jgi:hypothetical protein
VTDGPTGSDDPLVSSSTDETKEPDSAELPQVQVADTNPHANSSRTPDHTDICPRNCNGGRIGKIVPVKDTAHVTLVPSKMFYFLLLTMMTPSSWQAMIFYLFTGQISFAPLSSTGKPRTLSEEELARGYLPSKPSAKSMYRLADKVSHNC